jgi:hypothetical protein
MRIFGTIVQIAALSMLHALEHFSLRSAIARKFIGDEDTWDVSATLKQLAEKLLRRSFVPSTLHENIKYVAILIDGAPQIMPLPVNLQKPFVAVPFVSRLDTPTTELVRICLAELP